MTSFSVNPKFSSTLPILLGLLLGSWLYTSNVLGYDLTYFPGDLGDGRLNLYFLEHAYQFFIGKQETFWDAPFMYPETNVLAFSDNLLGSAPIYSFFRVLEFDTYKSYQLWFVCISSLNFITAFFFLKYVFKNNYAAVLGAFVFAFSVALQSQLTHAQTFPRFAIPLAFLMALKFSHSLKPIYLCLTLFFLVYQIYCGIYLGFMLAVPLSIYLLIIILREISNKNEALRNSKWWLQNLSYCALNILILLPLMLPYTERNIEPGLGHFNLIMNGLPTIKSHFFSVEGTLIWNFLSRIGQDYKSWWNHQIFAGGIATLSLIAAWYLFIRKAIRYKLSLNLYSTPLILLFTGLLTFILYLRFNDVSAYVTLYFLPGFSSMRALCRIINIELLFFGIAVAFIFSKISSKYFRFQGLLFLIALSLLGLDNYFYAEKSSRTKVEAAKQRTKTLEEAFEKLPVGSVVSYEPDTVQLASYHYQLDAMLSAQKYNLKTINAYTATCPGAYGRYWNELNMESRNHWLSSKELDVDTIYIVRSPKSIEALPVIQLNGSELEI